MPEQLKIPNYNIDLLKRHVYPNLRGINIAQGCGTRLCKICSEDSTYYKSSMNFEVLKSILNTYTGNSTLMLFGNGDPIYYQDGGNTIANVFAAAQEAKVRVNARTHGCLRSETRTIAAVRTLVEFLTVNNISNKQASLDFSVDEYGWFGVSPEEHLASVAEFYRLIAPLNPNVYAFSNRNAGDNELGSSKRLFRLLDKVQIPHDVVFQQEIMYFKDGDRPSRLLPKPPTDRTFSPWYGTSIETDGTILYNHPIFNVIRCGNIFNNIFTSSLPQPESG